MDWVKNFIEHYDVITEENVMDILFEEMGKTFVGVLEDSGVYKCTEQGRKYFDRFMSCL